ncbi:MAG: hypothetical protein JW818_16650 [Pirellulales bacterium]|nr:hypothetical protein [Pirellulales bacterium]
MNRHAKSSVLAWAAGAIATVVALLVVGVVGCSLVGSADGRLDPALSEGSTSPPAGQVQPVAAVLPLPRPDAVAHAPEKTTTNSQADPNDPSARVIQLHLGRIDAVKKQLLLMGLKKEGARVDRADIAVHIQFPRNPAGARYEINPIGQPPACYYQGKKYTLD